MRLILSLLILISIGKIEAGQHNLGLFISDVVIDHYSVIYEYDIPKSRFTFLSILRFNSSEFGYNDPYFDANKEAPSSFSQESNDIIKSSGITLSVGSKLMLDPITIKKDQRKHYLLFRINLSNYNLDYQTEGWELMDDGTYVPGLLDQSSTVNKLSFDVNFGFQWLFFDRIHLDVFYGLGLALPDVRRRFHEFEPLDVKFFTDRGSYLNLGISVSYNF